MAEGHLDHPQLCQEQVLALGKTQDLAKGQVAEAAIEHMNLMMTMTTSSSNVNEQGVRDISHICKQAVNGFFMR